MEDSSKSFKFYPIYFDSSLPIAKGRKYSLNSSISKPTFREIKQALDLLKINYISEDDKKHPKSIEEKGRFTINNENSRISFVSKLVEKIKEMRSSNDIKNKGSSNPLKLVPKKKSKKK